MNLVTGVVYRHHRGKWLRIALILLSGLALGGCLGIPEKVTPVSGFEVERYLGRWYEIARLDHSFERGLQRVTADYAMRSDGGIDVTNRGYSPGDKEWQEAKGKAYFVDDPGNGYLKVSFFGPFYGSYVVFGPDPQDYHYAYVSGPDLSYLWLLSRTAQVPDAVKADFIARAEDAGFDTGQLIWVEH